MERTEVHIHFGQVTRSHAHSAKVQRGIQKVFRRTTTKQNITIVHSWAHTLVHIVHSHILSYTHTYLHMGVNVHALIPITLFECLQDSQPLQADCTSVQPSSWRCHEQQLHPVCTMVHHLVNNTLHYIIYTYGHTVYTQWEFGQLLKCRGHVTEQLQEIESDSSDTCMAHVYIIHGIIQCSVLLFACIFKKLE